MMNNGEPKAYTLANLRKFTKYDFFLVPFFKTVEGQPSNSMVVQTNEDCEYTREFYFLFLNFFFSRYQKLFFPDSSYRGSGRRSDWYDQRHYRIHSLVGTAAATH